MTSKRSLRHWPVLLYVPNLIGYARILLSAVAFANYRDPWLFLGYYFVGFVLDGADGLAARKLDQASGFGAQLDMLTDRLATAALLTVLAVLYPQHGGLALGLVFLDGYSHWMQMVAGACAGTASHKAASRGWLLNFYYRRPVLTVVCALNEMCFLALYMHAFSHVDSVAAVLPYFNAVLVPAVPVCIIKQLISVRQVASAHATIVDVA